MVWSRCNEITSAEGFDDTQPFNFVKISGDVESEMDVPTRGILHCLSDHFKCDFGHAQSAAKPLPYDWRPITVSFRHSGRR
jgi:hypothetical protein